MFVYCDVRASQSIHENKGLWIAFRKKSKTNNDILSFWCSYMTGAYEACNYPVAVATLYKIAYANNKEWHSPSCTKTVCQWNQSTKKDIELKRINELFVCKNLIFKEKDTCAISREET